MTSVDVKSKTYINFNKENNYKDPKFKVDDFVRVLKYKIIFAKVYVPHWSEEAFVFKKIKNNVLWTNVIEDLDGEGVIGNFYKGELQKVNENKFRIETVIKRKGNKLYARRKGYDSSFNNSII